MLWAVSALGAGRGTRPRRDRHGFTLIEVLVATGLTLMLMAAVAGIFVLVSDNISDARATIEMTESLRATQFTLQNDLAGLTARGKPPLDPALGLGYIEYTEGPVGPCAPPDTILVDAQGAPVADTPASQARSYGENYANGVTWDTTVGDYDDILQFTTRSDDTPFTGRGGPNAQLLQQVLNGNQKLNSSNASLITETQSNVAEVSWFLRGRTLYRRVLLVDPTFDARFYNGSTVATGGGGLPQVGYYQISDVSVRQVGGPYDPANVTSSPAMLVANTLGDLTKRENRYGHPPMIATAPSNIPPFPPSGVALIENWPHDARYWGPLRLPTLRESSDPKWPLPFFAGQPGTVQTNAGVVVPQGFQALQEPGTFGNQPIVYFPPAERVRFDAWSDPRQWDKIDVGSGSVMDTTKPTNPASAQVPLLYNGTRYTDDVMLTNVVGFDIKVWDPGAPIFQRRMRVGVQDGGPEEVITIAPGDAHYFACLEDLFGAPTNANYLPIAYGAFVDLGWAVDPLWVTFNANDAIAKHLAYPPQNNWPPANPNYRPPEFHHPGNPMSGLWGVPSNQTLSNPPPDYRARIYDTGSRHYERDGIGQDAPLPRQWDPTGSAKNPLPDEASDGLDGNGQGGIDDATEREAPPPYDAELKAIQIKIRVFEADSRQVREVTVVQDLISQ